MKALGRCGFLRILPPLITVWFAAMIRVKLGPDLGVVVTATRGCSPNRIPSCNMSHVATGFSHFASSSHQAI